MLLTIDGRLVRFDIEVWFPRAGIMGATLAFGGNHAVISVLFAVSRCLALDIKIRPLKAGVVGATLVNDVHHAALSMLLAIQPPLAARDIEGTTLLAISM